jgi:hypothetical protein
MEEFFRAEQERLNLPRRSDVVKQIATTRPRRGLTPPSRSKSSFGDPLDNMINQNDHHQSQKEEEEQSAFDSLISILSDVEDILSMAVT